MNKSYFRINLSHPFILFGLTWFFTIFFYSLEITNNIKGLNESTKILIYTTFFIFVIINFLFVSIRRKNDILLVNKLSLNSNKVIERFELLIDRIFKVWFFQFSRFGLFNF